MSNEFSTASQLDLPIIETVNGQPVEFHRLAMTDIAAWANEIHSKRITDAKKRHAMNKALSEYDRESLIQRIADEDVQLNEVLRKSFAPAGISKALVMSLKKTGKDDGQALEIVKAIHFRRQFEIAQEVISPPPTAGTKPEGDGSPNPTDTGGTGDGSES